MALALMLTGCPSGDDGDSGTEGASASNGSSATSATSADSATTAPATSAGSASGSGSAGSSGGSGSSASGDSSDGSGTGGVCMEAMGSCANAETCCDGLMCCVGLPVPEGEEYCDQQCPQSDHKLKRDFEGVDPDQILERVAALPITTWSYRREDASIRHLGPMAQDFKASFGLGATDESIFVVDADGVALSSIQALYRKLRASEAENVKLREALEGLHERVEALEAASGR